ncbi:MAG: heme exporter protein CcmD [Pseudomonadota bacterium]
MMPDLGSYGAEVLSAYAVSLVLLALIVLIVVLRGRWVLKALRQVEDELETDG